MLACQEITIRTKRSRVQFINQVFSKSKHADSVIYLLDKQKSDSIEKRLKMISLEWVKVLTKRLTSPRGEGGGNSPIKMKAVLVVPFSDNWKQGTYSHAAVVNGRAFEFESTRIVITSDREHLIDNCLHASCSILCGIHCWWGPIRSKQLSRVCIFDFQFGLYHVVVPLRFFIST